jgi:hypothetical protein
MLAGNQLYAMDTFIWVATIRLAVSHVQTG